RPTDGSQSKWQISTNGGSNPRWSSNGREIFYHIANQQIISTSVSVSGNQIEIGKTVQLFKIDAGFQNTVADISADGKYVLTARTLNTQLLKNGSLVFQWKKMIEGK
ncbi:MAG: hypothetical protein WCW40_13075, partial [Bacteroidota bacterium]